MLSSLQLQQRPDLYPGSKEWFDQGEGLIPMEKNNITRCTALLDKQLEVLSPSISSSRLN